MKKHSSASGGPQHAGKLIICVSDRDGDGAVLGGAWVSVYRAPAGIDCDHFDPNIWSPQADSLTALVQTGDDGCAAVTDIEPGYYVVDYEHYPLTPAHCTHVTAGCTTDVCLRIDINAGVEVDAMTPDCAPISCPEPRVGDRVRMRITYNYSDTLRQHVRIAAPPGMKAVPGEYATFGATLRTPGRHVFRTRIEFATRRVLAVPGAGMAAPAHGQPHALLASHALGAPGPASAAAGFAFLGVGEEIDAGERTPIPITGNVGVALTRTETEASTDLPLWVLIRNSTDAMSFNNYLRFMDLLFCRKDELPAGDPGRLAFNNLSQRRFLPFTDTDAYRVLKVATEAFVMLNCGVLDVPQPFNPQQDRDYLDRRDIPSPLRDLADIFNQDYLETINGVPILPYLALIRRKLPDVPLALPGTMGSEADLCFGFMQEKLANPCLLELIWSYWHEEGMLVQSINAISRRFQNVHSGGRPDPLANLEIDPLRPLNNLIWGYTQDEQHRLTVTRRNHEYDHLYGLRLEGKAVRQFRPVDSRSPFLEAFHNLLRLCTTFFKQDDDTTVKADAFPVLNALKEVHLVLSQGAHNQFGDLPSTARIEMLMQQWLLGRPEFREFLPTRLMVAYPEPWMDRVDAMKKIQGWTDTSIIHFRSLAIFGEQLLLSIRYGAWSEVYESTQAFNWARFWRPQIQGYIHAYRAATGIDLASDRADAQADRMLPSILLQKRLALQQRGA